jgi:hypothetical protein
MLLGATERGSSIAPRSRSRYRLGADRPATFSRTPARARPCGDLFRPDSTRSLRNSASLFERYSLRASELRHSLGAELGDKSGFPSSIHFFANIRPSISASRRTRNARLMVNLLSFPSPSSLQITVRRGSHRVAASREVETIIL